MTEPQARFDSRKREECLEYELVELAGIVKDTDETPSITQYIFFENLILVQIEC